MKGINHDELDYAKSTDQSYRIRECNQCAGTGNSLAVQVTRKCDGFMWHCFRCRLTGFVSDRGASPRDVQRVMDNANKKKVDTRPKVVTLPDDFETFIPPKALVQLYDLGIMQPDILRFEIGWSQSHERIIIPVYKYGKGPGGWAKKLIGVLGRKLDSADADKPKWWSVRQRDIKHPRFTAVPETVLHQKQVVLVEDVFSAIKISSTGRISQALLTTYLPYEMYPLLAGWDTIIWLDQDAYTKALKYVGALGANNVVSKAILTPRDPKGYTTKEIEEIITHGRIKSGGT